MKEIWLQSYKFTNFVFNVCDPTISYIIEYYFKNELHTEV